MRTNSSPVPEAPTRSAAVYSFDLSHPLLPLPEAAAYSRTWTGSDRLLFGLTAPKVPRLTNHGTELYRTTDTSLQTLNIPDEDVRLRNTTARLLLLA